VLGLLPQFSSLSGAQTAAACFTALFKQQIAQRQGLRVCDCSSNFSRLIHDLMWPGTQANMLSTIRVGTAPNCYTNSRLKTIAGLRRASRVLLAPQATLNRPLPEIPGKDVIYECACTAQTQMSNRNIMCLFCTQQVRNSCADAGFEP